MTKEINAKFEIFRRVLFEFALLKCFGDVNTYSEKNTREKTQEINAI